MAISYEYDTPSGMSKVVNMTLIRDLNDDDLEGSFYIHITNGYIIRSIVHMLRDVMLYAILELSPTHVRILRYDKTGKIIIHLDLTTSQFTSYFFMSKKQTIKIGLDFSHLWHKMKILGKPDPFIAYKENGKDHIVLDFGSMARHHYNLQGVVEQHITLPVYEKTGSCHPEINITVRELSKAMTALRTNKSKIIFKGYKDHIAIEIPPRKQTFQRLGSSYEEFWKKLDLKPETVMMEKNESYCSLFNDACDNPLPSPSPSTDDAEEEDDHEDGEEDPIVSVEQTHTLLKSLAKVCNISDNSPIRVSIEAGKPIKMVIPVYQYGTLSFYMFKDPNPTAETT